MLEMMRLPHTNAWQHPYVGSDGVVGECRIGHNAHLTVAEDNYINFIVPPANILSAIRAVQQPPRLRGQVPGGISVLKA